MSYLGQLVAKISVLVGLVASIISGSQSNHQTPNQVQPSIPPSTVVQEKVINHQLNLKNFSSNGDYIMNWYWLRDSDLHHYGRWQLDGLKGVGSNKWLKINLTLLATNTYDGGRGYDADIDLYYAPGQKTNLKNLQGVGHIKTVIKNDSPPSDKVGYTCHGTVFIKVGDASKVGSMTIEIYRPTVKSNHIAVNKKTIGLKVQLVDKPTGEAVAQSASEQEEVSSSSNSNNQEELEIDEIQDSDNDGIPDSRENLYGTDINNPDSDGDGIKDGEDLSPLINPQQPQFLGKQKKGMIRIKQPIKAFGIDGWVEKYKWEATYKWGVIPTGGKLVKKGTEEDEGTKKSKMNQANYKKALNKLFQANHFQVYKIEEATPADIPVQEVEKGHDHEPEYSRIYPAKPWLLSFNEYRFYYDYLYDFQIAYLTNTQEVRYPSNDSYFRYLLFPINLKSGYDQKLIIQFKDSNLYDQLNYQDEKNYKLPALVYTLYANNDFADNQNQPLIDGLALVKIEHPNQFLVKLVLPKDKIQGGVRYLKLTPVWLVKTNGKLSYQPLQMNWDITGLVKETVYQNTSGGNSKILNEEFVKFEDLASQPLSLSSFQSQTSNNNYHSATWWRGVIYKNDDPNQKKYTVLTLTKKVVNWLNIGAEEGQRAANYTETFVKAKYKVDDLDELPEGHWARSPKYSTAVASLGVATGVVSMVTNGQQAWVAYKQGDMIKVTYYSLQLASAATSTAPQMVVIAEKSFGYTGKATKLGVLASKKASVGLALASGAVEIGYNIYQYNNTQDNILKASYGENIASSVMDTGLSAISVYSPHILVFTLTWMGGSHVYGWVFGHDLAYQATQSPGTAFVFLTKYFITANIPSQLATDVYLDVRNQVAEEIKRTNSVLNFSYLTVFIDPDL